MASKPPDLSEFLNPHLCANTDRIVDGNISPCEEKATMVCSKCYLVQYCCKACQVANWELHKPICHSEHLKESYLPRYIKGSYLPRYIKDNREPYAGKPSTSGFNHAAFGSAQYLWGNMPALDILNIDKNEGKDGIMNLDINLLFAASGDMRNVVKTVVGLPEGYAGNCVVVMNDHNSTVTARNAMMLLTAMHFEPETAVPIIMHLWYSVLLPFPIIKALQEHILPYVQQVCDKIKDKNTNVEQAKTFKFGDRSIRLVLKKRVWFKLSKMFTSPDELSSHQATQIRQQTTCAPGRVDFVDKALYKMPPGRRAGTWKFRLEGLLIPYGTSRKPFVYPNPTFFVKEDEWPMLDDADPLSGWFYNEYISHSNVAKNDVYGAFFNFLRSLLLQFCKRVRNSKIAFHLFTVNVVALPGYIEDTSFDRIEVANICDRGFVGTSKTLKLFSPMLKTKTENPHATILMLFLNAAYEEETQKYPQGKPKHDALRSRQLHTVIPDKAAKFLRMLAGIAKTQPLYEPSNRDLVDMILVTDAMSMFDNFDEYFNNYLQHPGSCESGSIEHLGQKYGVKIKAQHTIIKPWPYRVTEETTKEEFAVLLAGSTMGHERYVELEKLEEPNEAPELTSLEKLSLA